MMDFFKQKNELKHANRACRQFVLEAEEQATARRDFLDVYLTFCLYDR